ncbi:MAG: hypothetical protein JST54_16040 [Deltaproteobacteria bacterium]|nr:hypothetical protein [Deltaproteobacteria bacterium]
MGDDPREESYAPPVPLGLDAASLCRLLARLDTSNLPEVDAVFPSNGPQVLPLFRGLNAELLLVRWEGGQSTPVRTLGPSTLAVRPVSGELEVISFSAAQGSPRLEGIDTVGPGQIAGIPNGAVHALRARGPALTLHLCAPPVFERKDLDVASWF